ncbi:MAG: hypothetical protein H0V44_02015, partial [Planctomycetes bacterium]|nr:hypothetical protein [Planctomycetota bacterium]
ATLAADAQQVCYALLQPSSGAAPNLKLRSRTTTPGTTTLVPGTAGIVLAAPSYPCSMRLTRSGDVMTASYARDGVTFATHASTTLALPATVLIGMFVAHENAAAGSTAQASFANVAMTGQTGGAAALGSLADADADGVAEATAAAASHGTSSTQSGCGLGGGIALLLAPVLLMGRRRRGG